MKITEPVVLRKMHFGDIPTAIRVAEEALVEDPLQHYLRDTPDAHTGLFTEEWRFEVGVHFSQTVRKGQTLVIGDRDVDAMVTYRPAHEIDDGIDNIVKAVMPFVGAVQSQMLSPQQRERAATFAKAFREAVASVGDRIKEMVLLSGLVTRPAKQGRGYGSACVTAITDLADKEGRATWLGSSNVANRGFYESLGFVVIAQITLGETDPTWNEAPLVSDLMIREPRT
ncbi:hypothetical protein BC629DRAFT_494314 [Irpex lacteus]|nr:hypothetical protein BC629DRAFT_494314 [Irpex lacteus]